MGAEIAIQVLCHESFSPKLLSGEALNIDVRGFDQNLPWFELLARTALLSGVRLQLWHATGSDCVVLLPMAASQRQSWGYRRLSTLANYYTSLFSPIGNEHQRASSLSAICQRIAQDRPTWDVLDLHPMDPESDDFVVLERELDAVGFLTHRYFCFGNWYLPAQGISFSEYWSGRPSSLRNTAKRKGKAFARGGHGRFEIVRGGVDLEPAISAYQQIYAASWKVPEPHPEFIPGLIRLAATRGWLRLGLAWYDDNPVAAQIWLVVDGRAAIYKLAYDGRYADLSAGTLLTAHLMQHVLDADKVREVDYLIGDEPYKRDWMSHRRERWGIVAYNSRTIRGRIGSVLQTIGEWRRKLFFKSDS